MIKKSLNLIILNFFVAYWLITLLYCSPDNFIKISGSKMLSSFELAFSQRWNFFAPPPDFNNQLYFSYFNKDSVAVKVYEVTNAINIQKQQKAPFNAEEQFLDYILSSATISTSDEFNNFMKGKALSKSDSSPTVSYEQGLQEFNVMVEKLNMPGIKTLKNYMNVHHQKVHKSTEEFNNISYGRITITASKLPKFEHRDSLLNKNYIPKEELIYESLPIKL